MKDRYEEPYGSEVFCSCLGRSDKAKGSRQPLITPQLPVACLDATTVNAAGAAVNTAAVDAAAAASPPPTLAAAVPVMSSFSAAMSAFVDPTVPASAVAA